MSTCECNTIGGLVSTRVPTFRSPAPWNYCSTAYQYELFNTKTTLFMNESTNEFVYVSIPSLRSCYRTTTFSRWSFCHQRNQCLGYFRLFMLFAFLSAHEITKTWKVSLVPYCPFNYAGIISRGPSTRACGPRAPGFLKSFRPRTLVCVHAYVRACVCVRPRGH